MNAKNCFQRLILLLLENMSKYTACDEALDVEKN
jgi:hypothetical protein